MNSKTDKIKNGILNQLKVIPFMILFDIISAIIFYISTIHINVVGTHSSGIFVVRDIEVNLLIYIPCMVLFLILYMFFFEKYFKKYFKNSIDNHIIFAIIYVILYFIFICSLLLLEIIGNNFGSVIVNVPDIFDISYYIIIYPIISSLVSFGGDRK